MFECAIELLTQCISCIPMFVAVTLVFNICSDLLFNK